jgi:hypothetical protein
LIGFLCGCTSSNNDAATFSLKLEAASKDLKEGRALKMDSVNTNQWDAMFIFPPYTTTKSIEATLKSTLPPDITQSQISELDNINLLVFMQRGNIQMVSAVPRSSIDFSHPIPQPITRERARFFRMLAGGPLTLADSR